MRWRWRTIRGSRNESDLAKLYKRIGRRSGLGHCYETEAAQDAGARVVRRELVACRASRNNLAEHPRGREPDQRPASLGRQHVEINPTDAAFPEFERRARAYEVRGQLAQIRLVTD